MAKRLTQVLGVDIGTQSTKIAALRAGKDGASVTALGMTPTPEGTADHTGIFDPQTLGAMLKSLIVEVHAGVRHLVLCISGQSAVVVRILEVPKMSDADLAQHMQWEIERNVPFAESDTVSDFRPVENPALAATDNMEVVMAVSPRSAIETVLALIKAAGCKPAAIDVEPLGLGRVVQMCHGGDLAQKNVCVVHIGHSTTSINMYRQGVLAFPRTVPLGGSMLTQALADAFSLTVAEAEEKKRQEAAIPEAAAEAGFTAPGATVQAEFEPYTPFGEESGEGAGEAATGEPKPAEEPAAPAASDQVFQALQPQLEEFIAELRRSIDYYKSRGGEIEEIATSGGGANLKGLDAYMSRSMGLPVSRLNPFQGIDVSVSGQAETYVSENASEFAVAMGMGLHIAYD